MMESAFIPVAPLTTSLIYQNLFNFLIRKQYLLFSVVKWQKAAKNTRSTRVRTRSHKAIAADNATLTSAPAKRTPLRRPSTAATRNPRGDSGSGLTAGTAADPVIHRPKTGGIQKKKPASKATSKPIATVSFAPIAESPPQPVAPLWSPWLDLTGPALRGSPPPVPPPVPALAGAPLSPLARVNEPRSSPPPADWQYRCHSGDHVELGTDIDTAITLSYYSPIDRFQHNRDSDPKLCR